MPSRWVPPDNRPRGTPPTSSPLRAGEAVYDPFDQYRLADLKAIYLSPRGIDNARPGYRAYDALDGSSREDIKCMIEIVAGETAQMPVLGQSRAAPRARSPLALDAMSDDEDADIRGLHAPKRRRVDQESGRSFESVRPRRPAATSGGTVLTSAGPGLASPSCSRPTGSSSTLSGSSSSSQKSLIIATNHLQVGTTKVASRSAQPDNYVARRLLKVEAEGDAGDDDDMVEVPLRPPPPRAKHKAHACSIRPVAGKGLGLVADVDLEQGQLIIAESPLIEIDHPPSLTQIVNRMNRLPPRKRAIVESFTPSPDCPDDRQSRLVSIIRRNVIPLGGDEKVKPLEDEVIPVDDAGNVQQAFATGLFKHICRVNHSCEPNSRWAWHVETKDMRRFAETGTTRTPVNSPDLTAVQPIKAGTEITACYLQTTWLGHTERQERLQSLWSFECKCPKCSLPRKARHESDRRLAEIRDIEYYYIGLESEDTWSAVGLEACFEKIDKGIQLLIRERLDFEVPAWYASLFHLSVRWGDETRAKQAGQKWLDGVKRYGETHEGETTELNVLTPTSDSQWNVFNEDPMESDGGDEGDHEYEAGSQVGDQEWETKSRKDRREKGGAHRTRAIGCEARPVSRGPTSVTQSRCRSLDP